MQEVKLRHSFSMHEKRRRTPHPGDLYKIFESMNLLLRGHRAPSGNEQSGGHFAACFRCPESRTSQSLAAKKLCLVSLPLDMRAVGCREPSDQSVRCRALRPVVEEMLGLAQGRPEPVTAQ